MSKSIYEEANIILNGRIADGEVKSFRVTGETYYKITNALKQAQKQEKLLVLYKEFFDKLNIQLRNTFDIDYIYPHEFIIGYDIKSEDKELVKLFKQIKELLEWKF